MMRRECRLSRLAFKSERYKTREREKLYLSNYKYAFLHKMNLPIFRLEPVLINESATVAHSYIANRQLTLNRFVHRLIISVRRAENSYKITDRVFTQMKIFLLQKPVFYSI